jgi:hypothetical protein
MGTSRLRATPRIGERIGQISDHFVIIIIIIIIIIIAISVVTYRVGMERVLMDGNLAIASHTQNR